MEFDDERRICDNGNMCDDNMLVAYDVIKDNIILEYWSIMY